MKFFLFLVILFFFARATNASREIQVEYEGATSSFTNSTDFCLAAATVLSNQTSAEAETTCVTAAKTYEGFVVRYKLAASRITLPAITSGINLYSKRKELEDALTTYNFFLSPGVKVTLISNANTNRAWISASISVFLGVGLVCGFSIWWKSCSSSSS